MGKVSEFREIKRDQDLRQIEGGGPFQLVTGKNLKTSLANSSAPPKEDVPDGGDSAIALPSDDPTKSSTE
jgi:hypothetical protein